MLRRIQQSATALAILAASIGSSVAYPTPATEAGEKMRWPYRIVMVPDTQRYTIDQIHKSDPRKKGDTRVKLPVAERVLIFEKMMQWVADNAERENIKLMLHVGDLVEHQRSRNEYKMIEQGISKLDGKVPYVLAIGNHDNSGIASEFFPVGRNPLNLKMFGGTRKEGNIGDLYSKLTLNRQPYLIMTIDYSTVGKDGDSPAQKWANEIIAAHPDHKVLFASHFLLVENEIPGGAPFFAKSGKLLLDNVLTKHKNMYMTFCGHVYDRTGDGIATGYRTDTGAKGNTVHSTLFNSQWIDTNGGDGWMRIIEFHEDGKVLHKTYSPYLEEWNRGAEFEFEIKPD